MIAILNPPPRHVCECGCAARAEAKLAEVQRSVSLLDQAATDYRKDRDAAQAEVERLKEALVYERRAGAAKFDNEKLLRAREVERLRMEFRRIEECAAAMLAGERCYAQVMKLLHEAPAPRR